MGDEMGDGRWEMGDGRWDICHKERVFGTGCVYVDMLVIDLFRF